MKESTFFYFYCCLGLVYNALGCFKFFYWFLWDSLSLEEGRCTGRGWLTSSLTLLFIYLKKGASRTPLFIRINLSLWYSVVFVFPWYCRRVSQCKARKSCRTRVGSFAWSGSCEAISLQLVLQYFRTARNCVQNCS